MEGQVQLEGLVAERNSCTKDLLWNGLTAERRMLKELAASVVQLPIACRLPTGQISNSHLAQLPVFGVALHYEG
jgi:hypothetical protein